MRLLLLVPFFLFACTPDIADTKTSPVGLDPGEDGDGYTDDDCDDNDSSVHPGAPEVCNGIDDNCDGAIDEGLEREWYADNDTDGFGSPVDPLSACAAPEGYVNAATDCNDGDATSFPGADERCDGGDNDCDDEIDEDPVDPATWYEDADADGYGDRTQDTLACDAPPGTVADDTDCDDANADVHPGGDEWCNGEDDDCDGTSDEDALDPLTWYADTDEDGFGDVLNTTTACDSPAGYGPDSTDCDDADATINPLATEVCDGVDNDCDGGIDLAAADPSLWFADTDGDGFGDATNSTTACDVPSGYAADDDDCNDTDSAINPLAAEVCDGIDNDCDGTIDDGATGGTTWYADADGDGFGDPASAVFACDAPVDHLADGTDCDDADSAINPDATEVCDAADNDCDGTVDVGAADPTTWYADADGDGYGDALTSTTACDAPSGYGADASDCDDTEAAVYPGAAEVCDGLDNDCDGTVDGLSGSISTDADAAALADCTSLTDLYVHISPAVTTVELPLLEHIEGYLYLHANSGVTTLSLPALTEVTEYVYLYHNPALTDLDLGSLTTVGGYVYLDGNTAMSTVDIGSLTTVGGYIYYSGNSAWCVPGMSWATIAAAYVYIGGNLCN
ncbi:MAG: hypothetical protein EXR71_02665 [Myxococcales bacterium]|nr:hypothetical protein [Myxococcales bacterium]